MHCGGHTDGLFLTEHGGLVEQCLVEGDNMEKIPRVAQHVSKMTNQYCFVSET
jgi:hypothetical protein